MPVTCKEAIEDHPIPEDAADDVLSCCKKYFITLLGIVFDCYEESIFTIDAKWYYTIENFDYMDKTIEDAEEELDHPRGWTDKVESIKKMPIGMRN